MIYLAITVLGGVLYKYQQGTRKGKGNDREEHQGSAP